MTATAQLYIHYQAVKVMAAKGCAYVTPPSNSPALGWARLLGHLPVFAAGFGAVIVGKALGAVRALLLGGAQAAAPADVKRRRAAGCPF